MASQSKLFDDLSKLAQGALGAASSAREEVEASLRSWMDSQMQSMNLVSREDFDAVADMAEKARSENEALAKRVADLEATVAKLSSGGKGSASTTAKKAGTASTSKSTTAKSAAGKTSGSGTAGTKGAGTKNGGTS